MAMNRKPKADNTVANEIRALTTLQAECEALGIDFLTARINGGEDALRWAHGQQIDAPSVNCRAALEYWKRRQAPRTGL